MAKRSNTVETVRVAAELHRQFADAGKDRNLRTIQR
jgi:hypothetical protein